MNDRVGQQLGNYRLLRLLGRGGQASVYLGEHLYLKSQAAIKVRHTVLSEEEQRLFLQEAQTLVRLAHPHIVRVLDFALQDGMPFFVMEYAAHGTLRQRHPKGTKLSLDVIIPYIQQVASALQYTHDQSLVHRDLKPENLVLNSRDEVLLSDFGLVMHTPQALPSEATEPMEQPLVGTTPYLAPEQLRGKAQPASDQYALGVVVYEWLCGKPPFQGPFLEVAVQHVSSAPPSLCEQVPDISPAIEAMVLRALAKEPEQRFPSVQEFATALEQAYQLHGYLSPRQGSRKGLPLHPHHPVPLHFGHDEHGFETEQRHSMQDLPKGTVTMLFTDMEGSTYLLQQLGERYASVLAECRQLLRSAFQEWNGHEVDTQGDAFFVVFARATDAVSAVVDAQRALASHPWPEGTGVRVRIGLHTGEPSLTQEGYVGLDVHRTARIMSAGHGGQVLLSQATSTLVEQDLPDNVSLRDLGAYRLKDLGRPQRLFQLVIADLPADFPSLKTLDAHPNNLPIQPTPFIGREQELTVVGELLLREDVRLLTLTGPGGTGKTRLGLQVGADLSDRFVDGVFFVALAPISDPALVIPTIAETLGIREVAGQPPMDHLKEVLHQKRMLLLLDNFEQVISAAAQVADLLAACLKLKILVTSREVLHVRAEHEFAVPPLELPDPKHLPDLATLSHYTAVTLFLQRARAVKPDFQMTNANARAIAEICARLDGLPLAIELAAARMKLLSPQALLARLSQRLNVLTSMSRDVPARQQTLRNTIAWSYQLLNAHEQQLFRRLSVFVGGCTLEALEAIYAAPGDGDGAVSVLDGVASLIDKSLLQQVEKGNGETRFVMLETVREFGLECLATRGEVEPACRAHAMYYLEMSEKAELDGPQQGLWLEKLEREHDNFRAAVLWSLDRRDADYGMEIALRLVRALSWFWFMRNHLHEGQQWIERVLVESKGTVTAVRAKILSDACYFAQSRGDYDLAKILGEEGLALYRELGDIKSIAGILVPMAFVAQERGDFPLARSLAEESLILNRKANNKDGIAFSLFVLGCIATDQGQYSQARALHEESLIIRRDVGNTWSIAFSLVYLAQVLFDSQGDPETIRSLLEETHLLCKEIGDKGTNAIALRISGQIALGQDNVPLARTLAEESLVLWKEYGERREIARSLSVLARVVTAEGDLMKARTFQEESLMIASELGDKLTTVSCLEGLADVVALQNEILWAARLWGAAETLRDVLSTPIAPVYRADYERSVAAARSQLGDQAFAAAWAEGRTMTPEQALSTKGQVTIAADVPMMQSSPPLEHS